MLTVKKISKKVLGFGRLILTPGETGHLPEPYNEAHPTVMKFFSMGWMETVENAPEAKTATPEKAPEPASPVTDYDAKAKELTKMSLKALQEKAKDLGIEYAETDIKATLIQKIIEKGE